MWQIDARNFEKKLAPGLEIVFFGVEVKLCKFGRKAVKARKPWGSSNDAKEVPS